MNKVFLAIVFISIQFSVFGQKTDSTKLSKKEERKKARIEATAKSNALIFNKFWVLEVDVVRDGDGDGVYDLDPFRNFVYVEEEEATIELTITVFPGWDVRWNTVGGVDGKLSKYGVKPPKKEGQGVMMRARYMAPGANSNWILNVNGERTTLQLIAVHGGRLVFEGRLVHPDNSAIFKGIRTN